jgi:N-acetylglucosaminyldiphosphoundecaprenol N-acetyl-beta-D-mannosaminyltransferase
MELCLVGLPALKQDRLIARLAPQFPRTWFAGIGVTFSFITGEVRKPPVIVRRLGLEWFFRFLQEPRRLARRYFLEGVPFAIALFARSFLARFGLGVPRTPTPEPAADAIPTKSAAP